MSTNLQTFTPTAIANLELWLDASDFSTLKPLNGNTVSEWRDKSGNGKNFVQGTAVNQPTYTENISESGLPGLFITDAGPAYDLLKNDSLGITPENEVFVVFKLTVSQTVGAARLISTYTGSGAITDGQWILDFINTDNVRLLTEGLSISTGNNTVSAGNTYIFNFHSDASNNVELLINNVSEGTGTHTNAGSRTLMGLGEDNGVVSNETPDGYFHEVIIYSSKLTDNERLKMMNYLINKWEVAI